MNKKKILLTGSTGLLGTYLIRYAPSSYEIVGTYHRVIPKKSEKHLTYKKLDLLDYTQIDKLVISLQPDVVIHTASIGNVDYCQTYKQEATKINTTATEVIYKNSQAVNAKFIFFSTNAIYDGKKPLYNERSKPDPIDHYGWTKLQAEHALPQKNPKVLILRLMTMYGWNNPEERKNPVTWFIHELKKNHILHIVNDIYNNYLYAADAAKEIWNLIQLDKFGDYNIAGPEVMSRYELALRTAETFGFPKKNITPVPSSFFPNIAPRPFNTSFDIRKIQRDTGFQPKSVINGLLDMKKSGLV